MATTPLVKPVVLDESFNAFKEAVEDGMTALEEFEDAMVEKMDTIAQKISGVESVNGKTGVVVLDASDIPLKNQSTVSVQTVLSWIGTTDIVGSYLQPNKYALQINPIL